MRTQSPVAKRLIGPLRAVQSWSGESQLEWRLPCRQKKRCGLSSADGDHRPRRHHHRRPRPRSHDRRHHRRRHDLHADALR